MYDKPDPNRANQSQRDRKRLIFITIRYYYSSVATYCGHVRITGLRLIELWAYAGSEFGQIRNFVDPFLCTASRGDIRVTGPVAFHGLARKTRVTRHNFTVDGPLSPVRHKFVRRANSIPSGPTILCARTKFIPLAIVNRQLNCGTARRT